MRCAISKTYILNFKNLVRSLVCKMFQYFYIDYMLKSSGHIRLVKIVNEVSFSLLSLGHNT